MVFPAKISRKLLSKFLIKKKNQTLEETKADVRLERKGSYTDKHLVKK